MPHPACVTGVPIIFQGSQPFLQALPLVEKAVGRLARELQRAGSGRLCAGIISQSATDARRLVDSDHIRTVGESVRLEQRHEGIPTHYTALFRDRLAGVAFEHEHRRRTALAGGKRSR